MANLVDFFPYLIPFGKDQVAGYYCQIEKHQLKERQMEMVYAGARQQVGKSEGGVSGLGNAGKYCRNVLHQPGADGGKAGNVGKGRKQQEQGTKIEDEGGCRDGDEAGEQGVAGYSAEIIDDERKRTYLCRQGYAE